MSIDIADLVSSLTSDEVLDTELSAADTLGLTTSTWEAGDPTRTFLAIMARLFSTWTGITVQAIRGGLLDYATGGWLTLKAASDYDVTRIAATYATSTMRLTNAGGGVYVIAAGDVTFSDSATGKTYRNTAGGTLNAVSTLDLAIIAEEAGIASSAAIGEIDTIVSPTMISVTAANTTVAIGSDEETDAALRARCRDSLAALSPDGSAAAYSYVAKSALRTDETAIGITRTRVSATAGAVTVLLADPDGAPAGADVTRVDDLIQTQVVPLGVTCTVSAATEQTINIVYTAFVSTATEASDAEIKALVLASLEAYFATIPIGGFPTAVPGVGKLYHDLLRARISDSSADIFTTTLGTPATDTSLTATKVAILGTVTGTITRYDP